MVVTATHSADIINIYGRKAGLKRARKKTSRAVLPTIIAEIMAKK